jgi:CheY-like chemotaxis protein
MEPAEHRTLVLFADDQELIRDLWVEMLQDRIPHLEVAHAQDGEEAVRLAGELLPNLVVMDVNMPTLNGFDATRRLKGNGATAKIPVIAVTGVTDFTSEQAKEAGCDGYITKPVSPEKFFGEVSRVLKRA